MRKQKLGFQDAQFWYIKGYDHGHGMRDQLDSAVDSYRQAIRLNPSFTEAMHNLACSYEEQQRYDLGRKWFDSALKLDPALLDAFHGYALCALKQNDGESAIEYLDKAIDVLNGTDLERENSKLIFYRYLRALANKVLGNFKEAQSDYCSIARAFEIQEGRLISLNIFAMVMMPLEVNRKKLLQAVETFQSILNRYESDKDKKVLAPHYIDFDHIDKSLGQYKLNKHPKWFDKRIQHVIKTLRQRYFFKRFSLQRIRDMIDKMELKVITKKELLFFQKNKVYVIVSGSIIMKNHEKQTSVPETLAKFGEGDILNFLQDQSQIFNSLQTWFIAQIETEVAIFDFDYFNQVWNKDLMTEKLLLTRSIIQSHPLFSSLSELTIMTLVSEIFQNKVFQKDQVILHQSQYSPTLKTAQIYFQNRLSKFAEKIRQKKVRNKRVTHGSTIINPLRFIKSAIISEKKEKQLKFQNDSQDLKNDNQKDTNIQQQIPQTNKEGQFDDGTSSNVSQSSKTSLSEDGCEEISNHDENDGFFLILSGKCRVVNCDDGYCFQELKAGDFFGESEIIKTIGFGFFGDIIADSKTVECLFIPLKEFQKIPTFEQTQIKEYAESRPDIKMLGFQYSRRYNIDISLYMKYYN